MKTISSILVVDDDVQLGKTLAELLKGKGYAPQTAGSGREALEMAAVETPAVALIDLKLGDMPGLELMKQLKERCPAAECIVLTGYASQASVIEAVNLGAFGYVQKPYDIDYLLKVIRWAIERQEAAQALRESESRYKRLLASVTDYIYTVKLEQDRPVATSHGAGCEAVTGYTPEEFQTDPYLWYRMVYDEDRPAVAAQIARLTMSQTVAPLEHRLIHKDGSLRWVRNTAVPRQNGSGSLVAYDGLITDITECKRVEEEKEKLQLLFLQAQKMEAIGRLTDGIAHDFNNLLTSINGFAELMQHRLPPDSPFQEMVACILSSGRKAADLIHQLMTFSRKEIIAPQVVDRSCIN